MPTPKEETREGKEHVAGATEDEEDAKDEVAEDEVRVKNTNPSIRWTPTVKIGSMKATLTKAIRVTTLSVWPDYMARTKQIYPTVRPATQR